MDSKTLASYIDHTILRADTTHSEVEKLCKEAVEYGFHSVCIPPYYIEASKKLLSGSSVKVATVIGFPLGYQLSTAKIDEVKRAVDLGIDEIDVVSNVAAIKNNDLDYIKKELDSLSTTASIKDILIKIIFETCYLTKKEIKILCNLCMESGVDFVKTSTGFGTGGATVEDVLYMKKIVGNNLMIKASGGIKTKSQAIKMIEAGADRLGTSSGVKIIS